MSQVQSGFGPAFGRDFTKRIAAAIQRPAKIDCCRARFLKSGPALIDRTITGIACHLHRHPVSGGGPDKRSASHPHVLDRNGELLQRFQCSNLEFVRKPTLIDDLHFTGVMIVPDRAVLGSINFHRTAFRLKLSAIAVSEAALSTELRLSINSHPIRRFRASSGALAAGSSMDSKSAL